MNSWLLTENIENYWLFHRYRSSNSLKSTVFLLTIFHSVSSWRRLPTIWIWSWGVSNKLDSRFRKSVNESNWLIPARVLELRLPQEKFADQSCWIWSFSIRDLQSFSHPIDEFWYLATKGENAFFLSFQPRCWENHRRRCHL